MHFRSAIFRKLTGLLQFCKIERKLLLIPFLTYTMIIGTEKDYNSVKKVKILKIQVEIINL